MMLGDWTLVQTHLDPSKPLVQQSVQLVRSTTHPRHYLVMQGNTTLLGMTHSTTKSIVDLESPQWNATMTLYVNPRRRAYATSGMFGTWTWNHGHETEQTTMTFRYRQPHHGYLWLGFNGDRPTAPPVVVSTDPSDKSLGFSGDRPTAPPAVVSTTPPAVVSTESPDKSSDTKAINNKIVEHDAKSDLTAKNIAPVAANQVDPTVMPAKQTDTKVAHTITISLDAKPAKPKRKRDKPKSWYETNDTRLREMTCLKWRARNIYGRDRYVDRFEKDMKNGEWVVFYGGEVIDKVAASERLSLSQVIVRVPDVRRDHCFFHQHEIGPAFVYQI